jgi:hypothetical protein
VRRFIELEEEFQANFKAISIAVVAAIGGVASIVIDPSISPGNI